MAVYMNINGMNQVATQGTPIVHGWVTNKVQINAYIDTKGDTVAANAEARFIHSESAEFKAIIKAVRLDDKQFHMTLTTIRMDRVTAESTVIVTAEDGAIWTAIKGAVRGL